MNYVSLFHREQYTIKSTTTLYFQIDKIVHSNYIVSVLFASMYNS
jgi:hypothetical protein